MSSSIFLIGFMATGKTTVGRQLANALTMRFVDLDQQIERAAGCTVEEIFAGEGEPGFRARERTALATVIQQAVVAGPAVVATGGGTASNENSLAQMRSAGRVIALTGPLDALLERAQDPDTRPLLARSAAQLQSLYNQRLPVYRQAHFSVDTCVQSVEGSVAAVRSGLNALDALPADAVSDAVSVALGERSYPVIVRSGALDQLGALCRCRVPPECAVVGLVTDTNVAPLYRDRAVAALEQVGLRVVVATIAAGEASKNLAQLGQVAEQFCVAGLDRQSAIVALGGGVVGDLAGFVAATLFRGVTVVQVPTTLLAMIDSSIGGKTGVDLTAGKNLLGAVWQPAAVVVDPATLGTLPPRELRAGVGELVKYALLDGEQLLDQCEQLAPAVADGSAATDEVRALVRRCAAIKGWIVCRDERETTGERALLNLGHTVGHAIETEAGYGELLHGECVALGLIAACRVSVGLGLLAPDDPLPARLQQLLDRCGLDTELDRWLCPSLMDRLAVDKKRVGTVVRFVAVRGVGSAQLVNVELSELARILQP